MIMSHLPRWSAAITALILLMGCTTPPAAITTQMLENDADRLRAFVRVRADSSGEQVITWFEGSLFLALPGQRPLHVTDFEGFNNTRTVPTGTDTFDLLVREIMLYKDPVSGEVLDRWNNPVTGATTDVIHVANDPVNGRLSPRFAPTDWLEQGDDMQLRLNIPLAYPNPLPPTQYPKHSSGEIYTATEHFLFFFSKTDLLNQALSDVPATFAWFRTGPTLPWMEMGQRPAYLIYSATGKKLEGGFEALPEHLKAFTRQHYPHYQQAPAAYSEPNETSWTWFKKIIDERRKSQD